MHTIFSFFIHLIAVTQFSSSAKIIDYNYTCFIFAIELNNFPCDNNVLFTWAGSSEMQQILRRIMSTKDEQFELSDVSIGHQHALVCVLGLGCWRGLWLSNRWSRQNAVWNAHFQLLSSCLSSTHLGCNSPAFEESLLETLKIKMFVCYTI